MDRKKYFTDLKSIKSQADFEKLALTVFRLQAEKNNVYREFIKGLGIDSGKITSIDKIPFLPVELFKSSIVLTGNDEYETVFTSSGTTGDQTSSHYIKDASLYEEVFSEIFFSFYGKPSDYVILALLPSYLERKGSSLVYMMEKLIADSGSQESGFYLHDHEKLFSVLKHLKNRKQKTFLFGVTYALLDFVSAFPISFPELIVMETGGMKGKRKEMVREEVHATLCKCFGGDAIHSEYGMTELLSQAYSKGNGIFNSPPWMRILIRDPYDPLNALGINAAGGINIIDLANIDSCAFLATQDLGKVYDDQSFEVIGRFDFSDVRGCNLMVE